VKKVLVIDIGGTNIKFIATGHMDARRFPSGPSLTPREFVREIKRRTADWDYDRVSIGYPGVVRNNRVVLEPNNLGRGWVGFDFKSAFSRPVKVINDAAMQALGSYDRGLLLFVGLGTGLGSALVVGDTVLPLELAHLPYKKGKTYEDYVGLRGLENFGKKKWRKNVADVVERFKAALGADYVVLGGGNAKLMDSLPKDTRLGANENAFLGGFRLWEQERQKKREDEREA